MSARVAFVVDAGVHVGMGHLSRCTVLAEALAARGADCEYFVTHESGVRQGPFGIRLLDRQSPLPGAPYDAIGVDGYCFNDDEVTAWRAASRALLLVDDFAATPRAATLVLNHNAYAEDMDYRAYAGCTKLLGPKFALIRPGFRAVRQMPGEPGRVLLTLGGGETALAALALIPELARAGARHIDVALGSMTAEAPEVPGCRVALHRDADMAALLAKADVFISGLGVTYLEALAANRKLIGIQVADNQLLNVAHARAHGHATFTALDAVAIGDCYAHVSQARMPAPLAYPDSEGPGRVADHLLQVIRALV